MFTTEIRINGTLVGALSGFNTQQAEGKKVLYRYEYYRTESGRVVRGVVKHDPNEKVEVLVAKCLSAAARLANKATKPA